MRILCENMHLSEVVRTFLDGFVRADQIGKTIP